MVESEKPPDRSRDDIVIIVCITCNLFLAEQQKHLLYQFQNLTLSLINVSKSVLLLLTSNTFITWKTSFKMKNSKLKKEKLKTKTDQNKAKKK